MPATSTSTDNEEGLLMANHATKQIWFLTGSQRMYGEDVLQQVTKQSRQIAEHLGAAEQVPFRIIAKPVLIDAESIRQVMLEANSSNECLGVVTWMHTFSPAKM